MGQGGELTSKPLSDAVLHSMTAEQRFHLCDAEAWEKQADEADALAAKAEAEAKALRTEAQTRRNLAAQARARAAR